MLQLTHTEYIWLNRVVYRFVYNKKQRIYLVLFIIPSLSEKSANQYDFMHNY